MGVFLHHGASNRHSSDVIFASLAGPSFPVIVHPTENNGPSSLHVWHALLKITLKITTYRDHLL